MKCWTRTSHMHGIRTPVLWLCSQDNVLYSVINKTNTSHCFSKHYCGRQRFLLSVAFLTIDLKNFPPTHRTFQRLKPAISLTTNQKPTNSSKIRNTAKWRRKTRTYFKITSVRSQQYSKNANNMRRLIKKLSDFMGMWDGYLGRTSRAQHLLQPRMDITWPVYTVPYQAGP